MEVELVTESQLEEYNTFGVDDDNDGERCGICMDVVIDSGVLDCCQHWFCFACIDNWSTITNLCPLCQNEFQLITCVPVYDTIGSNNDEDDLTSREDDWCIEGKNNTLSFPSYYIDENAVVCLDGEGCKIRSRAVTIEEDPNLDTSIACDACDLWYHAFCVGFNPEGPSQDSWLCPRCVEDEVPSKPSNVPLQSSENIANISERLVEDTGTFSGKVSVSIADAGETAVVISLVEEKQSTVEPSRNFLSTLDGNCSVEKPSIETNSSGTQDLELSLSKLASFNDLHTKETSIQSVSEHNKSESPGHGFDLYLGISVSYNSVDETTNHQVEDHIIEDVEQKHSSIECFLSTDKVIPDKENTIETAGPIDKVVQDKRENIVVSAGAKRKRREFRGVENGEAQSSATAKVSAKKVKFEGQRQLIHKESQSEEKSFSHELKKSCKGEKSTSQSEIGIMDIVQGTYGKPIKQAISSKGEEKAAGLRVKKILRRSTEDKESSILVQKLRKEIRDSIRDKSSEQTGENNLYDPKLLEAFRAVVAKPMTDFNRPRPLDVVRAKKSLLQKGKIRESLTKKIYGIGGRRKKAWTRDCEVEFWKHRCLKIGKPEKIETLKSVLGLLRTNCESSDQKQTTESGPKSSILSRLYLADSSVFPRKDNIKPLSVIKDTKQNAGSASQTMDNVGTKSNNAIVTSETSIKVNPSGSTSGGSKEKSEKEASVDIRSDKRKWALQVLARKTAVTGKNVAQEQQVAVLKGNFPLLAQLPADMRPVLATSHHNKVPISVRQAQLQRLTEHFLKLTKIPVTRRTAEIELAVADAVNIEKEIADKSNSKLVYVNLCAQELLRRSDNMTSSDDVLESNPDPCPNDKFIESANDLTSCSDADEALRNAGLLSDSPPNSPNNEKDENDKEDSQPENVFEVDCQPDLDIYGDFEYDLEDEGFIGASSLQVSSDHITSEESKIKVLFSTLDPNRSDGGQNSENLGKKQAENFVEKQPGNLEEKQAENLEENQDLNKKLEESSLQNPSNNGEEEPSSAECEELYGPDKEPLIKNFPETSFLNPRAPVLEKVDHREPVLDKEDRGKHSSQKNPTRKEKTSSIESSKKSDRVNLIRNKVEAYIKEHIRPLCKSGVITVEQYKWAVGKTSDKIMKYHSKATNASFLIKEGEKVKKLAEQYVEAAQWEEGL